MRGSVNTWLGLALVAVLGAHGLVDRGRPHLEVLPEMVHSPAAESFGRDPGDPNRPALRTPVAGTLPRGVRVERYGPGPLEAARADRDLTAPPTSADDVARGRAVYGTFCTPCHGPGGAGDGPVVARGYPAPPPLDTPRARALGDGRLYHVITFGRGTMPAYGALIAEADRWRVIAYVRRLQQGEGR